MKVWSKSEVHGVLHSAHQQGYTAETRTTTSDAEAMVSLISIHHSFEMYLHLLCIGTMVLFTRDFLSLQNSVHL